MPRLRPLLFLLVAPLAAAAQGPAPKPTDKAEAGAPSAEIQALVRREVEKAKAELRDEVRAELQGQQSAREFLDAGAAPTDKPRLDFLQVQGYFRVRGDLFDDLSLKRGPDPAGYKLFPPPIGSPDKSTQTSANLRLRLEPILNVSEQVRVLAQVDLLDGVVMGSSPAGTSAYESIGQTPPEVGQNGLDRGSIRVKRAWGEVQTPLGLLSFGRMPDQWGLGISSNAGGGLDDDLGDNVDRLQLAIPVRQTFFGPIVVVPYYDINSSGLVSQNQGGVGQPFSLDKADERTTIGVRLARIDTDDELQRKTAAGRSSWNYGARYGYHTQSWRFGNPIGTPGVPSPATTVDQVRIGLSYHALDLWGRLKTRRWRVEAEGGLRLGSQSDARLALTDSALGPVDILQLGGAIQADFKVTDKILLGLEGGFASGDKAPGFGNRPDRGIPRPGSVDGSQLGTKVPNPAYAANPTTEPEFLFAYDKSLKNFRFNPGYRVDMILWRELLGGLTDAWYLKPSVRYDLLEGLSLRLAVIYSQAVFAASTPSTEYRPLGVEVNSGLHYASDDGFHAWLDWGMLQPLDGLGYGPQRLGGEPALVRAHALRAGLAIKF